MMILSSTSPSEYRGGRHGEAPASHDEKKTSGEANEAKGNGSEENQAQAGDTGEACDQQGEGRQNFTSDESADESTSGEGGFGMTEAPPNLPKTGGQVAKVLGNLTNDPRITNLLMLVIIAVGMGVHESIQTQMCAL